MEKTHERPAISLSGLLLSVWSYRLVRWVLAVVFLWSGMSKLADPAALAVIIGAYGLIPESWGTTAAVLLPALEVLAALGLLADIRGSLALITGLLAVFMAILAYGIWMGLDIDCGCFGPEDPESGAYHGLRPALYRDLVMMAGIIHLYLWRYTRTAEPVRPIHVLEAFFKRRD